MKRTAELCGAVYLAIDSSLQAEGITNENLSCHVAMMVLNAISDPPPDQEERMQRFGMGGVKKR